MKTLCVVFVALFLTSCSNSSTSPTEPKGSLQAAPSSELTCRSGYLISAGDDGEPHCVPEGGV
jgi:hypothetical protein